MSSVKTNVKRGISADKADNESSDTKKPRIAQSDCTDGKETEPELFSDTHKEVTSDIMPQNEANHYRNIQDETVVLQQNEEDNAENIINKEQAYIMQKKKDDRNKNVHGNEQNESKTSLARSSQHETISTSMYCCSDSIPSTSRTFLAHIEYSHESDIPENHSSIQINATQNIEQSVSDNLRNVNRTCDSDETMSAGLPASLPVEEKNFLKFCHVIYKIAPAAVRQRFDLEFPPDNLDAVLKKNEQTLKHLKEKRFITIPQWNLMFPGIGSSASSSEFDITLMLCLFRHLTKIAPVSGLYDSLPPPSDVTLGADLARIKYHRNNIAHNLEKDRKLDNDDFKIVWDDISQVCRNDFKLYQIDIK